MAKFCSIIRKKEFEKDLKKLLKRFRSLESDLQTFQDTQLILFHKHSIDNGGLEQISGVGFEEPQIFKARKFACRALKGKGVRSGIRVIYAYFQSRDDIELVEIYYKEKDHTKENRERIKKLYGKTGEHTYACLFGYETPEKNESSEIHGTDYEFADRFMGCFLIKAQTKNLCSF